MNILQIIAKPSDVTQNEEIKIDFNIGYLTPSLSGVLSLIGKILKTKSLVIQDKRQFSINSWSSLNF